MRDPVLLLAIDITVLDDQAVIALSHVPSCVVGAILMTEVAYHKRCLHVVSAGHLVCHDAFPVAGVGVGPQLDKKHPDLDCSTDGGHV